MDNPFPPSSYINRELSWIEFNRRVLQEAQDPQQPLLERAKFLSIFTTNLDEFFMIRVSGVKKQIAAGVEELSPDGLTPSATLDSIVSALTPLIEEHSWTWQEMVRPALREQGVHVLDFAELTPEQRARAADYFNREVYPVLTPLAFDPGHPFPHISNLSLSLAVVVRTRSGRERFARVKVPPVLPRLVHISNNVEGDGNPYSFIWLDQLIAANIQKLFPGTEIVRVHAFRVTRDTDLEIQVDEADDLLSTIERVMQDRRFGSAVRLEIAHDMPDEDRDILVENLELEARDVYRVCGPLDLSALMELHRLPLPRLKDLPHQPHLPGLLRSMNIANNPDDLFTIIRSGDQLVHHPYDSFSPVIDFIRAAARDPNVLAIKMTLYRVGQNAPVVQALIDAIQAGKQVAVLVELKARFDEQNNIQWARALEDEGVHVVYGLPRLKVHCKIALVVRREADRIRRYVHLGTGNYNATTARIYTDIGLFTCRDEIGEDATDLFNYLTGYSYQDEYRRFLVAPVNLRQSLLALIEREIAVHREHGNGRLIFKMNALVDPQLIDALYRASQAGVRVDLIVRGICCLRPGVPGISDNIRVISIVGRFLEHSRVYYFHNNGQPDIYIGSADIMQRNLDRRVETLFPILDPALKQRVLRDILELQLRDNVKARELLPDGTYRRVQRGPDDPPIDSQLEAMLMH
ncbi:MAG: polyphosphate kinase 1 [Anaerolineae bacterium]